MPMDFWSESVVRAIGDVLRNTIMVDDNILTSETCTTVRVLVEINVRKGLFESMGLV